MSDQRLVGDEPVVDAAAWDRDGGAGGVDHEGVGVPEHGG
jgi:hypothetical protein